MPRHVENLGSGEHPGRDQGVTPVGAHELGVDGLEPRQRVRPRAGDDRDRHGAGVCISSRGGPRPDRTRRGHRLRRGRLRRLPPRHARGRGRGARQERRAGADARAARRRADRRRRRHLHARADRARRRRSGRGRDDGRRPSHPPPARHAHGADATAARRRARGRPRGRRRPVGVRVGDLRPLRIRHGVHDRRSRDHHARGATARGADHAGHPPRARRRHRRDAPGARCRPPRRARDARPPRSLVGDPRARSRARPGGSAAAARRGGRRRRLRALRGQAELRERPPRRRGPGARGGEHEPGGPRGDLELPARSRPHAHDDVGARSGRRAAAAHARRVTRGGGEQRRRRAVAADRRPSPRPLRALVRRAVRGRHGGRRRGLPVERRPLGAALGRGHGDLCAHLAARRARARRRRCRRGVPRRHAARHCSPAPAGCESCAPARSPRSAARS